MRAFKLKKNKIKKLAILLDNNISNLANNKNSNNYSYSYLVDQAKCLKLIEFRTNIKKLEKVSKIISNWNKTAISSISTYNYYSSGLYKKESFATEFQAFLKMSKITGELKAYQILLKSIKKVSSNSYVSYLKKNLDIEVWKNTKETLILPVSYKTRNNIGFFGFVFYSILILLICLGISEAFHLAKYYLWN